MTYNAFYSIYDQDGRYVGFTDTLEDSWSTTVKSPIVLTSQLNDYLKYFQYEKYLNLLIIST